jgi:hypothetical protein
MKPTKYTQEGERVIYHYTFKQLRDFLTHGFREGNNGMILIGEDKRFYYYKGFGTIENPWKYVLNLSMEYDPVFDGKRLYPENYISFLKEPKETSSTRMAIWDAKTMNN